MLDKSTLNFFKVMLILLVAAWLTIFAAGAGILVKSEEVRGGQVVPKLVCTYFTGFGFTKKEHILTDINLIGKQICPRFINFN